MRYYNAPLSPLNETRLSECLSTVLSLVWIDYRVVCKTYMGSFILTFALNCIGIPHVSVISTIVVSWVSLLMSS